MARSRRSRSQRPLGTPQLATVEDGSIATADSVSTDTIYTSSTSNSVLTKPVMFHLGPTRVSIKYGSTESTVLAIVRKVPQGYTAPAVTVATGNTTFADIPNVLAYGLVRVNAGDTMNRIDLRKLRQAVRLDRGDSIVLQTVSNINSTGQVYSALIEFSTQ